MSVHTRLIHPPLQPNPIQSNHTTALPFPALPPPRPPNRRPPELPPPPPFLRDESVHDRLAPRLCRDGRGGVAPGREGVGGGLSRRGRGMYVCLGVKRGGGGGLNTTRHNTLKINQTNQTTIHKIKAVASPAHILGDQALLLKHLNPHTVVIASSALVPAAGVEGGAENGTVASSSGAQQQQGEGTWVVGLWWCVGLRIGCMWICIYILSLLY